MDDYISREAALSCFHDWIDRYGHEHSADEMTEYQRIEELPAADVRPAIRCNNCRYYFFGDCIHNQGMRKTDKDGFCFRFKEVSNE